MRRAALLLLLILPPPALAACDAPVCAVPPDSLRFAALIDFEDTGAAMGVGRPVEGLLVRDGASFGERFAGQALSAEGAYDRVTGRPAAPLRLLPGAPGRNLGALFLPGTRVLQGHGPGGHPRPEAVGEGAIAVLFDRDQPALGLDIRGGEGGTAWISFLRRDGSLIARLALGPLGESRQAFLRRGGLADIAGLVIENDDPEGIAIDNLRFDAWELLGALRRAPAGIRSSG